MLTFEQDKNKQVNATPVYTTRVKSFSDRVDKKVIVIHQKVKGKRVRIN